MGCQLALPQIANGYNLVHYYRHSVFILFSLLSIRLSPVLAILSVRRVLLTRVDEDAGLRSRHIYVRAYLMLDL